MTYFSASAVDNLYASLPKYGDDENVITFNEDDREQTTDDAITNDSSKADTKAEAVPELSLPSDKDSIHSQSNTSNYKKKTKRPKERKLKRNYADDTAGASSRFADEIHPPSLFSREVPPAPPNMHGPIKYGQNVVNSPSVFVRPDSSTPRGQGQKPQSRVQPVAVSLPGSILLPNQPVQPVIPRRATSISGYIVPSQIARSMSHKEKLIKSDVSSIGSDLRFQLIDDGDNVSLWTCCFRSLMVLVITLLLGSIVVAIVLVAL